MQKNKSIYFITLILPFLMPKESLYTCFTILFFIYFGNIYISKKALKEEIEVIEEKRLKKYVLFNIIIMIACLILSIIFTIIYKIKMINLIFSYALLCFFSVMIILMFKNKKKYN